MNFEYYHDGVGQELRAQLHRLNCAWHKVRTDKLEKFPPRQRMLSPAFAFHLWWKNHASARRSGTLRVGFGPVITDETTLHNRKWEIDPIVNYLNQLGGKYVADVFFSGDDLSQYDLVVIVKHFDGFTEDQLLGLRQKGTRIIFNVTDSAACPKVNYLNEPWILRQSDYVIVSNPVCEQEIFPSQPRIANIYAPVINQTYKHHYGGGNRPIRILWDGHRENIHHLKLLEDIVHRLAEKYPVKLIYHTNLPPSRKGVVEVRPWTLWRWEQTLVNADIAVSLKPNEDRVQLRKPPSKVVTYMAAGLPTVCSPSPADRQVIRHGETGFFAENQGDWERTLTDLLKSESLRRRVGEAARRISREKFSISAIGNQYVQLFNKVVAS